MVVTWVDTLIEIIHSYADCIAQGDMYVATCS
jgi:hypothetical protein